MYLTELIIKEAPKLTEILVLKVMLHGPMFYFYFFIFSAAKHYNVVATLGTLRFATTDGWTRVARCLGDWIEYGALWRVVARKLKLSCYTTNYVLREIAAVEFTLKMSFQKVRDDDFLNSAKSIHKTGLRT